MEKTYETAKYLFNDTSFLWYFVKKEGQVYFNTWHGTPFKTLGKSIKDDFQQRIFLICIFAGHIDFIFHCAMEI